MTHLLETFHASQALVQRLEAFWVAKAEAWAKTVRNNRIPAHEASKSQVSRAVAVLWFEFYTEDLSTVERNYIAYDFTKRWLDAPYLQTTEVIHPATRKKEKTNALLYVPVTDVLGDFIMRALRSEEKGAEYPVSNPDKVVRDGWIREAAEKPLLLQEEEDALNAKGADFPRGVISESELVKDELPEVSEPDVEDFRLILSEVKKNAARYAVNYRRKYGYAEKDTMQKIKRLDLSRVAECLVCGNAFYRHDMRRVYCDTQQSSGRRSTCQRISEEVAS